MFGDKLYIFKGMTMLTVLPTPTNYSNKKNTNPYINNWAVIFIDPTLCQEEKTLFCPINSAASNGAYIRGDAENRIQICTYRRNCSQQNLVI